MKCRLDRLALFLRSFRVCPAVDLPDIYTGIYVENAMIIC